MDPADRDMLVRIDTNVAALREEAKDHETRLRSLEKLRWILAGAWAVLGAGIAWVAKHF